MKRERLDFLADNVHYTKRFAYYVGRRCRSATIKDIAQELYLDWDSVKELDKQYMRAQLKRAGMPGPKAIGIDEISIRKGHTYRIVVSDLKEYIRYNAASNIFSNALSPVQVAAVQTAINVIRSDEGDVLRARVLAAAIAVREELAAQSFGLLGAPHAIVPMLIGKESVARRAGLIAAEKGVLINLAEFPVVAVGKLSLPPASDERI